MTKAEQRAIAIERFAREHGLTAPQVIELCRLARRAFKAGERATSIPGARIAAAEHRTAERFEEAAEVAGFVAVDWPGLWPVLKDRTGHDVYLPA